MPGVSSVSPNPINQLGDSSLPYTNTIISNTQNATVNNNGGNSTNGQGVVTGPDTPTISLEQQAKIQQVVQYAEQVVQKQTNLKPGDPDYAKAVEYVAKQILFAQATSPQGNDNGAGFIGGALGMANMNSRGTLNPQVVMLGKGAQSIAKATSKTGELSDGLDAVGYTAAGLGNKGIKQVTDIGTAGLDIAKATKTGQFGDYAKAVVDTANIADPSGGIGKAVGTIANDIVVGNAIGNGSLKGTAATAQGFNAVGDTVGTVGMLTKNKDLALAGSTLQGTGAAIDAYGKGQSGLGNAATISTSSKLAGGIIGGETGEKIALGGDIASNALKFAANTVPGAAIGNVVGIGMGAAKLLGAKIDPGVDYFANLGLSLAAGPVGFLAAGFQFISGILDMGEKVNTIPLNKDIDISGKIGEPNNAKSSGSISLLDKQIIGFGHIGDWSGQYMQYNTTGKEIDPRLLKNVEYKLVDKSVVEDAEREGDSTNVFGSLGKLSDMKGPESAEKVLLIKANYGQINPQTGDASATAGVKLSAADAEKYKATLGGSSGTINTNDPSLNAKLALIKPQMDGMALTYQQQENDATMTYYADVNGDKIPDRISISMNNEGLKKKGDGSVSIAIMDKDRNVVGDPIVAKGSDKIDANMKEAAEILQMRPLLEIYSASHPEAWDSGRDVSSMYAALKAGGTLPKLKEISTQYAEYAKASQTEGADPREALSKLINSTKELGMTFNAEKYAAANPDLLKSVGANTTLLTEHYMKFGNSEGRTINPQGDKLATYVPPALRNYTVVGSELTNGELTKGQALVSPNQKYMAAMQTDGNFVVYDISGKDKKVLFDPRTNERGAERIAIQSDGNFAAHNSSQCVWSSDSYNKKPETVNRLFKLSMQDDGNLAVRDSQGGAELWSSKGGLSKKAESNTAGQAPSFQAIANKPVSYGAEAAIAAPPPAPVATAAANKQTTTTTTTPTEGDNMRGPTVMSNAQAMQTYMSLPVPKGLVSINRNVNVGSTSEPQFSLTTNEVALKGMLKAGYLVEVTGKGQQGDTAGTTNANAPRLFVDPRQPSQLYRLPVPGETVSGDTKDPRANAAGISAEYEVTPTRA